MGETAIEWTDKVWNPVTGCSKVSQGCKNCYALRLFSKVYPGRAFTDVKCHAERLQAPLHWRKPALIFVNSMSDLFHEKVPFEFVDAVRQITFEAKLHTFQILTKRPERMLAYWNWASERHLIPGWPRNVWLGVSVEDQKTADERIPLLLQTPAAVRWISAEPMLGPIDLHRIPFGTSNGSRFPLLDWVVTGGESGPGARPMHPDWARSLRDQCVAAGVPFFFKQWGEWMNGSDFRRDALCIYADGRTCGFTLEELIAEENRSGIRHNDARSTLMTRVGKKAAGRLLDGREWSEFPEAVAR